MAPLYSAQSIFDVKNIVAVVTGAGSGIGKVMADTLAANGAKAVYILGRRQDALAATKSASPNPEVIHTIVCDVTSKESLAAAAEEVRKEMGYCDVVFANSGVVTAEGSGEPLGVKPGSEDVKRLQRQLWEPSMEEFTQGFHVNVTGVFYTAVAFLDLLDEGNRRNEIPQKSQIIVTSSIFGFSRPPLAGFAYGASKAAATYLTKSLATTFLPLKIRVNAMALGLYPSEMTERLTVMQGNPREEGNIPLEMVPLERCGSEEELAGIALFLTSKAGGFIDGVILVSDGGAISQVPATY